MSLVYVDDATLRCSIHGIDVRKGRACPACAVMPVIDATPPAVGFYEAATASASAAGAPGRVDAEVLLWGRGVTMDALRDDLTAERHRTPSKTPRDRSHRAYLAGLIIKAHEAGSRDYRAASDMILFRERMTDAERADRLYAERQRKAGRARA